MLAKWKAEERFANLYNTAFYDMLTPDERSSVDTMYEETYNKKYPKVARIWTGSSPDPVNRYE
jgi:hypothetical protein